MLSVRRQPVARQPVAPDELCTIVTTVRRPRDAHGAARRKPCHRCPKSGWPRPPFPAPAPAPGEPDSKSAMPSAPAPAAHILGIHPAVGSVGLRANFVHRWHRNGRAVTYMTLCTEIVATRVHGPGGPTPIDCRWPAHPRGQVRKVRCRGHCRWHPRIAGCSRRGNRRPTAELCTLVTTNRHPSDTNDNVGRICCQQWPKFAARRYEGGTRIRATHMPMWETAATSAFGALPNSWKSNSSYRRQLRARTLPSGDNR